MDRKVWIVSCCMKKEEREVVTPSTPSCQIIKFHPRKLQECVCGEVGLRSFLHSYWALLRGTRNDECMFWPHM
jgi:hypothetical protein